MNDWRSERFVQNFSPWWILGLPNLSPEFQTLSDVFSKSPTSFFYGDGLLHLSIFCITNQELSKIEKNCWNFLTKNSKQNSTKNIFEKIQIFLISQEKGQIRRIDWLNLQKKNPTNEFDNMRKSDKRGTLGNPVEFWENFWSEEFFSRNSPKGLLSEKILFHFLFQKKFSFQKLKILFLLNSF